MRYSIACGTGRDRFSVDDVEVTEELARPYEIRAHLTADSDDSDTLDLLGRDACVTLERGTHVRDFHGIVAKVAFRDNAELRQTSVVTIRPALVALELTKNTRLFQEKTAVAIIEQVLSEGLAPYGRTFDGAALDASTYATRDYCVQHQETDLDFVHRMMEEEGIGYYFEAGEHEVLTLFARSQDLPSVVTLDDGPVPFDRALSNVTRAEPLVRFCPVGKLAPTGITVRDHDWTRGRPTLERSIDGDADRRPGERAHEVYEHGFERHLTISEDGELLATMLGLVERAVMPAGVPVGLNRRALDVKGALFEEFTSSDSEHQARVRRERLRRDARTAEGTGLVTGFAVGHHFELLGHPTLGADGTYLVTKVVHRSHGRDGERDADEGELGRVNYQDAAQGGGPRSDSTFGARGVRDSYCTQAQDGALTHDVMASGMVRNPWHAYIWKEIWEHLGATPDGIPVPDSGWIEELAE